MCGPKGYLRILIYFYCSTARDNVYLYDMMENKRVRELFY